MSAKNPHETSMLPNLVSARSNIEPSQDDPEEAERKRLAEQLEDQRLREFMRRCRVNRQRAARRLPPLSNGVVDPWTGQ